MMGLGGQRLQPDLTLENKPSLKKTHCYRNVATGLFSSKYGKVDRGVYGKQRNRPRQRIFYTEYDSRDTECPHTYAETVRTSDWTRPGMRVAVPRRGYTLHHGHRHYSYSDKEQQTTQRANSIMLKKSRRSVCSIDTNAITTYLVATV
ncbi:hypothetical protein F2P81_009690 [Scophthalmus maximus]|uniref:Uncharacterized protein n=1 Tax=Scophthalmus maximus TaxID=52904 RepID=A0A6A4SVE3_SCOMX|nr:hypothetical protein F2P81_009690 [Scophthalmus maximus]